MVSTPKQVVKKLVRRLGYKIEKIAPTPEPLDPVVDKEIGEIYKKYAGYTMTTKERIYALSKAVEYIVNAEVPGDLVECGVWKGGSTMVMARTLLKMGKSDRRIFLYDTFMGMNKPKSEDYSLFDEKHAISTWNEQEKKDHNEWCFSSLKEVRANMLSTGYPENKLVFIEGKVENTIPNNIPAKIALLRLDTDWYDSTMHELTHLYPILAPRGVLIIDDYGYWAGSKKATDEYFRNKPILLNRIDCAGRIGIKS